MRETQEEREKTAQKEKEEEKEVNEQEPAIVLGVEVFEWIWPTFRNFE